MWPPRANSRGLYPWKKGLGTRHDGVPWENKQGGTNEKKGDPDSEYTGAETIFWTTVPMWTLMYWVQPHTDIGIVGINKSINTSVCKIYVKRCKKVVRHHL